MLTHDDIIQSIRDIIREPHPERYKIERIIEYLDNCEEEIYLEQKKREREYYEGDAQEIYGVVSSLPPG